jgi:uncharacterized membrane protein YfcA
MEYVFVAVMICLGAILTFFSGFGLGTIMLPVFGLFFPLPVAIGATAVVHLANNIFKMALIYRHIDRTILFKFGLPAIISASIGSYLLVLLGDIPVVYAYQLGKHDFHISWLKITIGLIMIFFAWMELSPTFKNKPVQPNQFIIGGLLSGFFGGISGHQGAFRSLFLSKSFLSKEAFLATSGCIGLCIDITRISIYAGTISFTALSNEYTLLFTAMLFAFTGTFIGKKLLTKTTMKGIQQTVGILLIIFGFLLLSGLI